MYSQNEFLDAQKRLRDELGESAPSFSKQQLIPMLRDEIIALRHHDYTDDRIVALINRGLREPITVDELRQFEAEPEFSH